MPDFIAQHLGESFALTTAIFWAFAVILFRRSGEVVHPIGLNLFKCVLAGVLLIPTAWLFGESVFRAAPLSDHLMLLASGALGIGVADTLFFHSLNRLGASLTAIVVCLYSPSIIAMSMIWLGEKLSVLELIGAALIVSAVLAITIEKRPNLEDRKRVYYGVLWGTLGTFANAIGIVMIKPLLTNSPLFWATEMRLVGGLLVLLVVLVFLPNRGQIVASIKSRQRWGYTLSGAIVGTYFAMVLWLGGMKYTQASIAAALNQTSNIFVFILAALILKEKITPVRLGAIAVGVGGAMLVTFG